MTVDKIIRLLGLYHDETLLMLLANLTNSSLRSSGKRSREQVLGFQGPGGLPTESLKDLVYPYKDCYLINVGFKQDFLQKIVLEDVPLVIFSSVDLISDLYMRY